MTTTQIKKEIFEVLIHMGLPLQALTEKASFQKDLGLDSLDFAELVMEFEYRFNVELPILEMEKVTTIRAAIGYLNQRLSNN